MNDVLIVFTKLVFHIGSLERLWPGYKHYPWWISWACLLHKGLYPYYDKSSVTVCFTPMVCESVGEG